MERTTLLSTQPETEVRRRFPIGAEPVGDDLVHFRVWAPAAQKVEVVFSNGYRTQPLRPEEHGYFSAIAHGHVGEHYRYRLNGSPDLYPDPASRFQPHGPHHASEIVDSRSYRWHDATWRGIELKGQVIYELHVGTFTRRGTWASAQTQLEELARLGVTVIEVMPVAEFDGRFGWGYDGVDMFAPSHLYGRPEDLRRFVDAAHAWGLGVILDVVYNHFGPVGNYLRAFSPDYFSDRYTNEWGDAINFDGPGAAPVREFFLTNAAYWIDEFHFDGLRLDATQQIFDTSDEHIITAIGRAVRAAAGARHVILIAEDERQDTANVRPPDQGGRGLDGVWNDDFHHSAMVALTGRREAYYSDTRGDPQELVSAAKYGYLFQGQYYHWQRHPRGTPALDVHPAAFVNCLQNHDQVANSARGLRGHQLTSPGKWRAMTALLLLCPATPMLFQGQEFAASAPFLFFADFDADLNDAVRRGRCEFLTQFPSVRDYIARGRLDDPASEQTFARCKLDFAERETNRSTYLLHEHLLRLRRDVPAFKAHMRRRVDGAVLSAHAFLLRFFGGTPADDRLLIVNLGAELNRRSFAEPLLAPPLAMEWSVSWSSEDAQYGGLGTRELWPEGSWSIPPESAVVCAPRPLRQRSSAGVRRRTA